MDAQSCTLEINVLSAENLCIYGKPIKKNAFVVVRIDSLNCKSTKADYDGGSFPLWNEKLVMNMPMHVRFITLEVHYRSSSSSNGGLINNRVVGSASIPVTDFLADYTPENYLHFLSYRLRDSRGQRNGIVNFSVRAEMPYCSRSISNGKKSVNEGYRSSCSSPSSWSSRRPTSSSSSSSSSSWSSLRPTMQVPVGVPVAAGVNNYYGEVATGVPVWCASRA